MRMAVDRVGGNMDILVIGFGNALRRDDGIGPYVARRIAARRLPGVRTLAVHQLTPELADELSRTDVVIFVDADCEPYGEPIRIQRIDPEETSIPMWHAWQPAGLVALTQVLYGRAPDAWSVGVAGKDLTLGEGLSPGGRQHANAAADDILKRLLSLTQASIQPPNNGARVGYGK